MLLELLGKHIIGWNFNTALDPTMAKGGGNFSPISKYEQGIHDLLIDKLDFIILNYQAKIRRVNSFPNGQSPPKKAVDLEHNIVGKVLISKQLSFKCFPKMSKLKKSLKGRQPCSL